MWRWSTNRRSQRRDGPLLCRNIKGTHENHWLNECKMRWERKYRRKLINVTFSKSINFYQYVLPYLFLYLWFSPLWASIFTSCFLEEEINWLNPELDLFSSPQEVCVCFISVSRKWNSSRRGVLTGQSVGGVGWWSSFVMRGSRSQPEETPAPLRETWREIGGCMRGRTFSRNVLGLKVASH